MCHYGVREFDKEEEPNNTRMLVCNNLLLPANEGIFSCVSWSNNR